MASIVRAASADLMLHIAYKDDCWLNLGVAFEHEDGDGMNVLLQALPIDGKLVLRRYKEEVEEEKPKPKRR